MLKENIIQKLKVFEREVLRVIFGPTKKKIKHGGLNTIEQTDKAPKYSQLHQSPETKLVRPYTKTA